MSATSRKNPLFNRKQATQLGLVVGAHAMLLGGMMSYAPTREILIQLVPVTANLVTPPKPEAPPPPPPPPPRQTPPPKAPPKTATPPVQPVPQPPAAPPAVITAAPSPAPAAAVTAPSPAPAPLPPIAAPAPSPAPAPAVPTGPTTRASANAAYLHNPKPEYPAAAKRLGETGRVTLTVQVTPAGLPEQVRVRTSSGSERLDQAALKAVRQWRFVPAKRAGEAIADTISLSINFTLEDDEE